MARGLLVLGSPRTLIQYCPRNQKSQNGDRSPATVFNGVQDNIITWWGTTLPQLRSWEVRRSGWPYSIDWSLDMMTGILLTVPIVRYVSLNANGNWLKQCWFLLIGSYMKYIQWNLSQNARIFRSTKWTWKCHTRVPWWLTDWLIFISLVYKEHNHSTNTKKITLCIIKYRNAWNMYTIS